MALCEVVRGEVPSGRVGSSFFGVHEHTSETG
jgi:hypothetical protein